jgi:hypothetical protein
MPGSLRALPRGVVRKATTWTRNDTFVKRSVANTPRWNDSASLSAILGVITRDTNDRLRDLDIGSSASRAPRVSGAERRTPAAAAT